MPLVTAASNCPRFCSLKTNDTVSGVLAGVVPKPTAPGTLAALIPGVTRTSVLLPGPVEALAAVTAPAASPAQRRKRTDLAILFCSPYVSDAPAEAQGAPSGQRGIYQLIFSPTVRNAIDDLPFYLKDQKVSWCLDAPGIHTVDLSGQNATAGTLRTGRGAARTRRPAPGVPPPGPARGRRGWSRSECRAACAPARSPRRRSRPARPT